MTDATGQTATITLDNKAIEFQSSQRRQSTGLEYDPGLDSAQGGGTSGGFPMWEGNGDWTVRKEAEHAECYVDGGGSLRVEPGIQRQTLNCYVEWMDGQRQDVDLQHCRAGANNAKPATQREYGGNWDPMKKCPAPKWEYGGWTNTSYGTPYAAGGKTCGTSVQFKRKVSQSRSASCSGSYSNKECRLYISKPYYARVITVNAGVRNLGPCQICTPGQMGERTRLSSGRYPYESGMCPSGMIYSGVATKYSQKYCSSDGTAWDEVIFLDPGCVWGQ